jgi:predicted transcriptional regulator
MILLNQMNAASQGAKALALNRAGFSNGEIADLLGSTAGTIAQQLYSLRGSGPKASKARKRPTKKNTKTKSGRKAA